MKHTGAVTVARRIAVAARRRRMLRRWHVCSWWVQSWPAGQGVI
jgi:hypothetical protein